jgi:hypothetical protein
LLFRLLNVPDYTLLPVVAPEEDLRQLKSWRLALLSLSHDFADRSLMALWIFG